MTDDPNAHPNNDPNGASMPDMNKLIRADNDDRDAMQKMQEAGDDIDTQKTIAADAVGLSPRVAHRLVGDSPESLLADARELAESAGQLAPQPQHVGFDGGARELPPPGPPSMSSLLRAERDQRRQDANDGARAYDRLSDRRFGK